MNAVNVVEFEPRHLLDIGPAFEMYGYARADEAYGHMLQDNGPTWSLERNGIVIGCGGILKEHMQCGTAWTVLTPQTGACMTRIHRLAVRVFELCPFRRVQAHVDPAFVAGRRWIQMLGFNYEGTMTAFSPEGRDMMLFARIKT